jgi:hypothetical protein
MIGHDVFMSFVVIRECAASAQPSLDVDFITNRVNQQKTVVVELIPHKR